MEQILKLQYISLCSKVSQELENHIGVKDKTLTEFIIELAKEANTEKEFQTLLEENDAEFTRQFSQQLYLLIRKMIPKEQSKKEIIYNNEDVIDEQIKERDLKGLRNQFPALAIANNEELDLNLDNSEDEKVVLDEQENINNDKKNNDRRDKSISRDRRDRSKSKNRRDRSRSRDRRDRSRSRDRRDRSRSRDRRNRSRSRNRLQKSQSRDRRNRSRSRDRRDRHRSRNNSRSKSQKRSKNQRRSKSKDRRKRSPSEDYEEVQSNKIYSGIVTKVMNYGCFILIEKVRNKKEGLAHISNLDDQRVNNASDIVKVGQKVFVKVLSIVGSKISLSLKDVDQKSGIEKIQLYKNDENILHLNGRNTEFETEFGALTGIRLTNDGIEEQSRSQAQRIASPELWEQSRMKYFGVQDQKIEEILDQPINHQNDDDMEIELNDQEAPFLKGQTTKCGVNMSPIKVVKNPDGTLQREALNALQYARERKELREQQVRSQQQKQPKGETNKYWEDPTADPGSRALSSSLKGIGQQNDVPEWKKAQAQKQSYPFQQRQNLSIKEQRENLPIYGFREELLAAVAANKILIIIGETGSGKTTQITQYLYEAGYASNKHKIGCTQPRRVAALSVSKRVAHEMQVVLGEEVGYSIRFQDFTSPNTLIKYMTDGMLLREALLDKDLSNYSCIMLDEAHERTIHTDVLFGIMKAAAFKRDDFRLIVTSATLDAEKFSTYFNNCQIFRIPGRTFPVEILYTKEPESDYLDAALTTVMQIHLVEPSGDILLFLTGQEEIDTACQILFERMKKLGDDAPELIVVPVYSALPTEMQSRIFEPAPPGSRKCVIATNIAEASLTIDGIFYVVDPGFSKVKVFNPKLGMDTLVVAPISQASTRQRAGRAGRTGPGKCYRLFTENSYKNEMLPTSVPEIQRTNLANTVLLLKAMGINDLLNFDFMDPPPIQTLIAALENLYALSALDDEGLLTKLGRRMAEFPLEPPLSKMLLTSVDLKCSDEIITIVAMLSVQNVFYRPKDKQNLADQKHAKFNSVDGDHLTLLNVYEQWKQNNYSKVWCHDNFVQDRSMRRAQDVRKQLITLMERHKYPIASSNKDTGRVRKAITAGFFMHASKKDPQEGYRTLLDNQQIYIHPSSSLFNKAPEWAIYNELVLSTKEYMREVVAIEPKWLVEVAPKFFKNSDIQSLSKRKKMEKLEPLQSKFEDPNAWRLSRRKG